MSKIFINFLSTARASTGIKSQQVFNFKYHGNKFSLRATILLNLSVNIMRMFITKSFIIYYRWVLNTLYTVIHKLQCFVYFKLIVFQVTFVSMKEFWNKSKGLLVSSCAKWGGLGYSFASYKRCRVVLTQKTVFNRTKLVQRFNTDQSKLD